VSNGTQTCALPPLVWGNYWLAWWSNFLS